MTQTSSPTEAPANIAMISGWTGPHYTGAHRTDIALRTPATYLDAQAIVQQLVDRQGYDPNSFVFITTGR